MNIKDSKPVQKSDVRSEGVNMVLLITSKCTLKCKLCTTYAPYNPHPNNYSIDIVIKGVDKFFSVIDKVGVVNITGGEPLLHPELPKIIDSFSRHIDKINQLEFFTNGTVIPSKTLLQSLKFSDKVVVFVDNYGPSLSTKFQQCVDAFVSAGIECRTKKYYGSDAHLGGWLDVTCGSLRNRTEQELCGLFNRCTFKSNYLHNLIIIDKDKAFMCYVNHNLVEHIPEINGEYVDLFDETLSQADLRYQLLHLRDRKYLNACKWCNGFVVDAERYMPAEQL
jgi:MoaA/NifB/PqqE/SkfB family radical SAM enzyme